jgi:LysM repeat protein
MKMKFKFPRLKFRKRKKLRATAVRRPLRAAAADYEEMSEPNMKLSRALLIVLVLHVVAVSGIIAFNAIKTRQGSAPAPMTSATPAASAGSTSKPEAAAPPMEVKRAHAVSKPADDSHKTYTVAKGDNPVTIAKKLKVPYDDLIALNHIDDPRKLKVGQKLLIPNKTSKPKKSEE